MLLHLFSSHYHLCGENKKNFKVRLHRRLLIAVTKLIGAF